MQTEQHLIDSLLKLEVSDNKTLGNDTSIVDDTRTDCENDFGDESPASRFRRTSDGKSPPPSDPMTFSLIAPSSTTTNILDGKLDSASDFVRSPPRFNGISEKTEEFSAEAFALEALSGFDGGEEPKSVSLYQSAGDSGRSRSGTTATRENTDDLSGFNREYRGFESIGTGGGNASHDASPRDDLLRNPTGNTPRGITSTSPRSQLDTPYLSQHGFSPAPDAPQSSPQTTFPASRYPAAPLDTAAAFGGRIPAAPLDPFDVDPYYGAAGGRMPVDPLATDPYYAGQFRAPYGGKTYGQAYRQPGAAAGYPAAPMHDPYGYGVPPMPGYMGGAPGAGRYGGKPMPAAAGAAAGYRGADSSYYRGAAPGFMPPPAPYGYGNPYAGMDDPYYTGPAAAVNRALGRPVPGPYAGPDGFRGGAYGNPINSRLRDRALPVAEPVNLETIDQNTIVYQVQFKKTIRNFTLRPGDVTQVQNGDFVIVQADRGEDLGVVTESFNLQAFMERRFAMRAYMDEEDQNVGYIIRIASSTETKLLPEKFQDEEMIFKTCENLAIHTYRLPMTVVDVEYQFDRHKITIYYDSPVRIDFRELVRDLFSSFKARIWMKKINQFQAPDIKHFAAMALATGVQFTPTND